MEGATENSVAVQALIDNLMEYGLDPTARGWLSSTARMPFSKTIGASIAARARYAQDARRRRHSVLGLGLQFGADQIASPSNERAYQHRLNLRPDTTVINRLN
jgi:hypothetical protein